MRYFFYILIIVGLGLQAQLGQAQSAWQKLNKSEMDQLESDPTVFQKLANSPSDQHCYFFLDKSAMTQFLTSLPEGTELPHYDGKIELPLPDGETVTMAVGRTHVWDPIKEKENSMQFFRLEGLHQVEAIHGVAYGGVELTQTFGFTGLFYNQEVYGVLRRVAIPENFTFRAKTVVSVHSVLNGIPPMASRKRCD